MRSLNMTMLHHVSYIHIRWYKAWAEAMYISLSHQLTRIICDLILEKVQKKCCILAKRNHFPCHIIKSSDILQFHTIPFDDLMIW